MSGALLKASAAADFQIVSYESHKAKPKPQRLAPPPDEGEASEKPRGIDIQRARREIIKFGISGFSSERQREAKVALAVSLGARPAKKESQNYKVLQAQRKRQQALDRKYAAMQQVGKNALGVSTARKKFVFNKALQTHSKPTKKQGDILQIYGKATIDTAPSRPKAAPGRRPHKRKGG